MRRPNLFSRGNDMDSTMTPMIDVVFLLLVFFVWTASFHMIEYILPSKLSSQIGANTIETSEPTPEEDFEKVIVRLQWQGSQSFLTVNEAAIGSLAELDQKLSAIAQIKTDAPVIVHPDDEVPLGDVIEVYDVAKSVGFSQVSFAVDKG
jgi:biopolymer transport protein ExbD